MKETLLKNTFRAELKIKALFQPRGDILKTLDRLGGKGNIAAIGQSLTISLEDLQHHLTILAHNGFVEIAETLENKLKRQYYLETELSDFPAILTLEATLEEDSSAYFSMRDYQRYLQPPKEKEVNVHRMYSINYEAVEKVIAVVKQINLLNKK